MTSSQGSLSLGSLPCVAQVWVSLAEPLELFCLAHGLFLIRRGPENQSDSSHLRRVPSPVPRGPSGMAVPQCFLSRMGCPASTRHTFLLTHRTYLMLSEFPNQRKKDDLKPISGNVFSATERQAWGDKAHSHMAPQKVGETSGNKFVVFSLF